MGQRGPWPLARRAGKPAEQGYATESEARFMAAGEAEAAAIERGWIESVREALRLHPEDRRAAARWALEHHDVSETVFRTIISEGLLDAQPRKRKHARV
jgi:hypothetical protein